MTVCGRRHLTMPAIVLYLGDTMKLFPSPRPTCLTLKIVNDANMDSLRSTRWAGGKCGLARAGMSSSPV